MTQQPRIELDEIEKRRKQSQHPNSHHDWICTVGELLDGDLPALVSWARRAVELLRAEAEKQ